MQDTPDVGDMNAEANPDMNKEMNNLRNLVIQGLEAKGVLSKLRAQIRANVFNIILQQESGDQQTAFYDENPVIQKVRGTEDGLLALELINEFLGCCKMDYTQNLFQNEGNVKKARGRSQLASQLGIQAQQGQSLLVTLVQALRNGGLPSGGQQSIQQQSSQQERRSNTSSQRSKPKTQPKVDHDEFEDMDFSDLDPKVTKSQVAQSKFTSYGDKNKQSKDDQNDNIDFQEIEDLIDENLEKEAIKEAQKSKENPSSQYTSSEEVGMTVSQSQGYDLSFDSVALEDYDHHEDVERM